MALRERQMFSGSTRVSSASYDPDVKVIEVVFVDGVHWNFYDCSPDTWRHFRLARSAGQFVREILERHPHGPA